MYPGAFGTMLSQDRSTTHRCRRTTAQCCRVIGRRTLAWLLLCCSLLGCRSLSHPGPIPQSVASARQLTQQGMNAMERDDWKRAESLLNRAVETCSTDADARRNYAETLWHRGAMPEALVQIEEARRLSHDDPSLCVRAGELYLAMGRTSEASRIADEALVLDPKLAPAWALRGRVARSTGQTQQALAYFQRSLGYAPDNHDVALLVAETYRELNQPDRALIALEALSDSYSPGTEPQQVLYLQGLALTALGRYEEAIRSLTLAAHRDRPTPDVLCHLAEAQLLSGRYSLAQTTVQGALTLDPNHSASQALSARMATAQAASGAIRR